MTIQTRPEHASTLVLFDWGGKLLPAQWLDIAIGFFVLVGAVPNAVAYRRESSTRARHVSVSALARVKAYPDLCSVEIHDLIKPGNDWGKFSSYAGFNMSGRKKTTVFSYDCSALDVDLFSSLTQKLADITVITYGYAFVRKLSLGPVMFAYDLSYDRDGGRNAVEEQEMVLWKRERMDMTKQKKLATFRHLQGFFRDVYSFNILTQPHLQHYISGRAILDWIPEEPWRGSVHEISAGVWLWVVLEEQRFRVRRALQSAGLLIVKLLE